MLGSDLSPAVHIFCAPPPPFCRAAHRAHPSAIHSTNLPRTPTLQSAGAAIVIYTSNVGLLFSVQLTSPPVNDTAIFHLHPNMDHEGIKINNGAVKRGLGFAVWQRPTCTP